MSNADPRTTTSSAARCGAPRCRRCRIASGRPLPDAADVVVIGGGYAGINAAARAGASRASRSRSSRPRRSAGAPRPATAGSSIPATSGARASSSSATARRPAAALYDDTLDGYETVKRLIAEESIDCDFREVGYVELAYAAVARAASSSRCARAWPVAASSSMLVPREQLREEIGSDAYHGGARRPGQRPASIPGRYFAGLAAAADRAGADLHEGVRARTIRRQADGRFVVETERGAILARDVVRRHERLHGRRRARRSAAGSSRSAATSSPPSRSPMTWSPSSRRKGRAFFDTKNFLYYWHVSADRRMVFGGRASMLPTIDRPDRARSSTTACSRSTRSSPAAGSTTRGAATSASPSTGCRMSGGRTTASRTRWAAAAPGVALMTHLGHEGRGVAGGRRGAGARRA